MMSLVNMYTLTTFPVPFNQTWLGDESLWGNVRGGGSGTHMAIRSAHELRTCMRRAREIAGMSDGEGESVASPGHVSGGKRHTSTWVRCP